MNLNIDLESIRRMLLDSGVNLGGQLQTPGSYGRYTPDFSYGSYNIPATDPTYSSGYEYARTLAGGMPFEDVVAPGMSFSPEDPMGYTQADLDLRNRYMGEGPAPFMPSAPTKGTPLRIADQMDYAPVGVREPTKFGALAMPIKAPGMDSFDGTGMSPIPEDFVQTIDRSKAGLFGLGFQPEQIAEPERKGLGFFKVDQNLFNFEEIADKIDMEEVAKIDIEKINIPETVSLFSDILKDPIVDLEQMQPQKTLPSVFDRVMPVAPKPSTIEKLPQSVFENIPDFSNIPDLSNIPMNFTGLPKMDFTGLPSMPVIPQPIVPTPVIPQIPVMPQIPQTAYIPPASSFIQPRVEEIVSPIRSGSPRNFQQPGLFNLV